MHSEDEKTQDRFNAVDNLSIFSIFLGSFVLGLGAGIMAKMLFVGIVAGMGSFLIALAICRSFSKIVRFLESNGFKYSPPPSKS